MRLCTRWFWLVSRGGVAVLTALGLLVAVGCSGSDDKGGKTGAKVRFEVTDQGQGEVNAEPLWPMRPGARWEFGPIVVAGDGEPVDYRYKTSNVTIGITRVSDRFGEPLLLEQSAGSGSRVDIWLAGLGWAQGHKEAYWSMDAEGLVLRAMGTNDPLETPLLIVPAEVRDGMKWVVRNKDGAEVLSGQVSGGEVRDTIWGPRRVWKVETTVAERNPFNVDGQVFDKNGELLPTKWSQEFVEGRGPADAVAAILPLEDQPPNLPKRRAMQPMPKVPKEYRGSVAGFSVTQDPATGHFEAQLGVLIPGVIPTQMSKMVGNTAMADTQMFYDRRICFRTDGKVIEEIDPTTSEVDPPKPWDWEECQDAAGVVYDDQGNMSTRLPFRIDGTAPNEWFYDHGPGIQVRGVDSVGTFVGTSFVVPGAKGFARDKGIISGGIPLYEIHEPGNTQKPGWKDAQNPSQDGYMFSVGPWAQQWGLSSLDRAVGLAPEKDKNINMLFMGEGRLGHGRIASMYEPQPIGGLDRWQVVDTGLDFVTYDEFVIVTQSDNHRQVYQVSEDGLIWKVEFNDGVVQRTFLAAVEVPEGHQVIGVVPVADDELQVWTQQGFVWQGMLGVEGVGFTDIYSDDVWQHAWKVKVDAGGKPEPPPLTEGLYVQASGRDVLVCAPAGNTLPADGWTLGGEVPEVIEIDGRCVLLMRPQPVYTDNPPSLAEADLVPVEAAAWVVGAVLPDVGGVQMVFHMEQPSVPTDLISAGNGTLTGGIVGPEDQQPGGVVRIWGPGKAMIEHYWGPKVGNRCSAFGWEVQLWDVSNRPGFCDAGLSCYGVVRIGSRLEETKAIKLPEGLLKPQFSSVQTPSLVELPDGCQAVQWGAWYYRLDDELGPVEIADPFASPSPDWALCEEDEFIDHNYTYPDVSRYNCNLSDGTSKVVDLPRFQLRNRVPLNWFGASYYLTKTNEPYVWRLDHGTWDVTAVKVPNSELFGGLGVWGIDGYCGTDGECYLLLVGRSDDPGTPIPWQVVRVDEQVSGIHPVFAAWTVDGVVPEHISGDDSVFVVTGASHIIWRGYRNLEPTSCVDCDQQEMCISGYCDCEYGMVRYDGYCETDVSVETYLSCKDARTAGVPAGEPVRIDGDGPDWPTKPFITMCDDTGDWTSAPLDFELSSATLPVYVCALPGSEGASWVNSLVALQMSSRSGLFGEFEVVVDFDEVIVMQGDGYTQSTSVGLMLADAELFDPVTGIYNETCQKIDSQITDNEIYLELEPSRKMGVGVPDTPVHQGEWPSGTLMKITREGDGLIRIYSDDTLFWTSSRAYLNDFRLIRFDHARIKLLSMRWKGSSGGFCIPRCNGKECGPDECGGTCGECQNNAHCAEGLCECDEPRVPYQGDGDEQCILPVGTEEYPARSCQEAYEAHVPWFSTPWIDPDGDGGEAPFQMESCSVSGGVATDQPWTIPPIGLLGPGAALVLDNNTDNCSQFGDFTPPFAWPVEMSGATASLKGALVASNLSVAATSRYVSGRFFLNASLYVGNAGQPAKLHLDPLASFSTPDAAWLGWTPACGKTADLSQRLTLEARSDGIWLIAGEAAAVALGPSSYGYVELTRLETGEVEVRLSSGDLLQTIPAGLLADELRIVLEVTGGEGCRASLANLKWW